MTKQKQQLGHTIRAAGII